MRDALGLATGLAELQRAREGAGNWQSGVREDLPWLGDHLEMSEAEIEAALDLLVLTQIVQREYRGRDRWLRVETALLDEIPGLAQLAWSSARERIDAEQGSRRPTLAVLTEIARLSGVPDAEGHGAWCSMTHRALCDATFYQQTAVASALQVLEGAELIERHTRAGRRGGNQYRILAPAYGRGERRVGRVAPERGPPDPQIAAGQGRDTRTEEKTTPPSAEALGAGAWLKIADGPRVWVPAGMAAIPTINDRGEMTITLRTDR